MLEFYANLKVGQRVVVKTYGSFNLHIVTKITKTYIETQKDDKTSSENKTIWKFTKRGNLYGSKTSSVVLTVMTEDDYNKMIESSKLSDDILNLKRAIIGKMNGLHKHESKALLEKALLVLGGEI